MPSGRCVRRLIWWRRCRRSDKRSGLEGLRARAGVLTGEAAVNIAAVGEGMVAGDLVNTASRVQSVAEPGSVFVGESTRRATEGTVVYEPAGSFELKGKEGETPLWRALRVVSGRGGSLKSEGLEAPFVGRDRELRQIKDLFHVCAEEGRAQLVSVTGIAGIGKSRLAWEFYKYFDGIVQTVYWHRGRCLAYGEGVTYWALADMVRWRCGIAEDDQQDDALRKLHAALDEHLLDPEERRFVEPRLAAAPRPRRGRLARPSGPVRGVASVLRAARRHVSDRARVRGHAVGGCFVARFRRVPARVVARQTAVRGHARKARAAGEAADLGSRSSQLYLALPRAALGAGDAGAAGWPRAGASDRAARQILARAEGVPLYAVETVRMLLDRGLLVEDGSAYKVVGEVETLEVPETLHALIAARLDGLSPDERRLLGDAAVLGKTFARRRSAR